MLLIAALAAAPGVRAQGGDSASLLFLGVCAAVAFFSPLRRLFVPRDERDEPRARNASTFALLCAMSALFPLARRYAPVESLALKSLAPGAFTWTDDRFPISLAAAIALLGALITIGPTWRACSGVVRASALALATVAAFGVGSFFFLGRFYPVGPVETVDPTPLVHLLQQAVEWGALVLLCHAAVAHRKVRGWLLSALPIVLILVWAKHQGAAPPAEEE